jgi:hypothetical protein
MRAMRGVVVLLVVALAAPAAWADYITLPIKWSQQPNDPNGGDWSSNGFTQFVADDFQCTDPDSIKAVRWWGSYFSETAAPRPDGYASFTIAFFLSTPGQPEAHPYSLPVAPPVATYLNITAQEVNVGREENDEFVYRYDAYLPKAFDQWTWSQSADNGIPGELWIGIFANTSGVDSWGWEAALVTHPVLDYAAYANIGTGWQWQSSQNTDMAFELMTPEPATLALLGLGAAALAARARRRRACL